MREYWIFAPRPRRRRIDVYVLDEMGRYQPVPPQVGGIYHSTVIPNFRLNEAWLWQEEPDPLAALVELVGTEQMLKAVSKQA